MVDLLVVAAVIIAVVVPFVVVPEVAQRLGYNPRSSRVRTVVWLTFLAILFVPAAVLAPGFLPGVSAVDWLLFLVAVVVAILYDYHRLNPDRVPWRRRSG